MKGEGRVEKETLFPSSPLFDLPFLSLSLQISRNNSIATQAKIRIALSLSLSNYAREAEYAPSRFSLRGRGGSTHTKIILGSNFSIKFIDANITSPEVENIKRATMSYVKIPKRSFFQE